MGHLLDWRVENQNFIISTELREGLVKAKLTNLARLLDVLAMAGWKPGKEFTRKEAVNASSGLLSAKTIWTAVNLLDNRFPFFPSFSLQQVKVKKRESIHGQDALQRCTVCPNFPSLNGRLG